MIRWIAAGLRLGLAGGSPGMMAQGAAAEADAKALSADAETRSKTG